MRMQKTKRPPGNWAASSSRENSSNGGKVRQNFLEKSYESKNGGVKRFLLNKCLCFQSVTKSINTCAECTNLRQKGLENFVSQYFLKPLTQGLGAVLRRPRTPIRARRRQPFYDSFGEVQRDKFHLLRTVKHLDRDTNASSKYGFHRTQHLPRSRAPRESHTERRC